MQNFVLIYYTRFQENANMKFAVVAYQNAKKYKEYEYFYKAD